MFARNYDDHANAIAVGSLGNGHVTGASVGSGDSDDYATIKYVQKLPAFAIRETVQLHQSPNTLDSFGMVEYHNYIFFSTTGFATQGSQVTIPTLSQHLRPKES
jgi:hypothetical protein